MAQSEPAASKSRYARRWSVTVACGSAGAGARVCLVTPLRDGMNLVAKEYVAAQDAYDPGVLVLSRFTGAARQMTEAVIVNPFSREEMAEAIKKALNMDREERVRRWTSLMEGVRRDDVTAWRDTFVDALKACHEPKLPLVDSSTRSILREALETDPETGRASSKEGLPADRRGERSRASVQRRPPTLLSPDA